MTRPLHTENLDRLLDGVEIVDLHPAPTPADYLD
jgi:hypothetical protein